MATGWGIQAWGVDTAPGGPGTSGDNTPPVISNITPAAGVTRGSRQPVGFDVTDDVGLRRVLLWINFGDPQLMDDMVHDGTNFGNGYKQSTRVAISGGFRYSLVRISGWPTNKINLEIIAIDSSGNEL